MIENFNETKILIDFIEKKEYDIKQKYLNGVFDYVEKYYTFFKINKRELSQLKRNIFIGKLAELCLRNLIRENNIKCDLVKKKNEEYDKGFDLLCEVNNVIYKIESKSTENANSNNIYIREISWMNFDYLIFGHVDINLMKYKIKFICDYNTINLNLKKDEFTDKYFIDINKIS